MKKVLFIGLLLVMLFSMTGFSQVYAADSAAPRTYTILVGAQNTSQGVSIMSFFPSKVSIHVGDTVIWKANSNEIHTVTFLAGTTPPDLFFPAPQGAPSPLMANPAVFFPTPPNNAYDGSTFENSGILSLDPGQARTFSLTFTTAGVFDYLCLVHGMMMSGTVEVVDPSVPVPTPAAVNRMGRVEMLKAFAKVPSVLQEARRQIVPPVQNPDGTTTHTVLIGYSSGVIDVMRFFPKNLDVRPGDTVVWKLSQADVAPHTVTFINGNPDPDLIMPFPYNNTVLLLLNPAVLFPSPAVMQGTPLNKTDFFNSGFMQPGGPDTFSLKIGSVSGTLEYECLLHDTSGMVGSLNVSNNN